MSKKISPRSNRAISPQDFPVEICVLFEQAAMNPIRVPAQGGFETWNEAFGSVMTLRRWLAAMRRSPLCPRSFLAILQTIQLDQPKQDEDGWHYIIKSLEDNKAMQMIKDMVPAVSKDEFWSAYQDEVVK